MITISVPTAQREQLVDITRDVQDAVSQLGCSHGICHIHTAHTTAGITINENADPDVVRDILLSLDAIVHELPGFRHAEGNSTAHVKSTLTGNSVTVPVENGRLVLGTWQGIYFCEFDGPRSRRAWVSCTPSA